MSLDLDLYVCWDNRVPGFPYTMHSKLSLFRDEFPHDLRELFTPAPLLKTGIYVNAESSILMEDQHGDPLRFWRPEMFEGMKIENHSTRAAITFIIKHPDRRGLIVVPYWH